MEHCSHLESASMLGSCGVWLMRRRGEAPRGKGKCLTGLDICVLEALEWAFIMCCQALCPLSSLTGS